jgi:hypothetical protein
MNDGGSGRSGAGRSGAASLRVLCVLCVKYIGADDLTQSTERYTEFAEKTRTANEQNFVQSR